MKKLIKLLLQRMGIVAFKRSSGVYLPETESYRLVVALCGTRSPFVIDGGAHLGDSVAAISQYVPNASFHCFEPDPHLVSALQRRFAMNQSVHIVAAALGDAPATAKLHINASRPTSSLLGTAASTPADIGRLCATVDQIDVEVVSVDSYCAASAIASVDILKLDLQGYDYKALVGAKNTLRSVRVVLTEVWFSEVYAGAERFHEVIALMWDCGFSLYTLCGLHYGQNDELLWGDAIFVRSSVEN